MDNDTLSTGDVQQATGSRVRRSAARAGHELRQIVEVLLVAGILFFVAFVLYQPVRVEGTSMLPVLEDQDQLFINKVALSEVGSLVGEKIEHGNVVVFRYPHDTTKKYIKRVIGVPGDTVRISHGTVIVNGVPLQEPYVPAKYSDERSLPELTLEPGEYFMMGDHRSVSSDSRDFGPVKRDLIEGRAAFVFWPMDQAGVVR